MTPTPNPAAFEDAVRAHLEPVREQFNYAQMLHTCLSVERFELWARVVARHRQVGGARFLSSGCGYAGSLLAYQDAGAATVTGVEVDPDALRFGSLRVAGLPNATVVAIESGPLPFVDDAFDVIESMDVIEHTPDPRAYLAELARVLAPGGLILLVTPNRLWPVEQHLDVVGPPWLPVGIADALFSALARAPWPSRDRRFRYERLRGMRTHNISARRLRNLASSLGLFLQVLPPHLYGDGWPLPRHAPWLERLAAHRFGSLIAPVRTLAVTLEHADARAARPAMRRPGAHGAWSRRPPRRCRAADS
ncbi:MAG: methyltransferase domain-containing protein [Egibacteraceae bacterium]